MASEDADSGSTRLSVEQCSSPENEHAELIRELEAKYAEDIRPIRDLSKNFDVKLDVLEKYVSQIRASGFSAENINFANAGLLLQSSKEVYARKVDYYEKLSTDLVRITHTLLWKDGESENDNKKDSSDGDKHKNKKKNFHELEKFKLTAKADIPVLSEELQISLSDGQHASHIPRMHPCFLAPTHNIEVFLRDSRGETMGRKYDFRVNWPISDDGVPIDLECGGTLSLGNERTVLPNEIPDDISEIGSFHEPVTLDTDDVDMRDSELDLNDQLISSTPLPPDRDLNTENREFHFNVKYDVLDESLKCWVRLENLTKAEIRRHMKPRKRKIPDKMTLSEFLHGKKRKTAAPDKKTKDSEKKKEESNSRKKNDTTSIERIEEEPPPEQIVPIRTEPLSKADISLQEAVERCRTKVNSALLDKTNDLTLDENASIFDDDDVNIFDDPISQNSPDPADLTLIPSTSDDPSTADSQFGSPTISSNYDNLEIDPLSQRIRQWEDKITPILNELERRPKFKLAETARSIVRGMTVGDTVHLSSVLAAERQYEVSRRFVALLQLCNSRTVSLSRDGDLTLLSSNFRLSEEKDSNNFE